MAAAVGQLTRQAQTSNPRLQFKKSGVDRTEVSRPRAIITELRKSY